MAAVRNMSRPLPQPPGYRSDHEATWYEHEERMRPSYVLQPRFSGPFHTPAQPPVSPSARWAAIGIQNRQYNKPFNPSMQHMHSPATPTPQQREKQYLHEALTSRSSIQSSASITRDESTRTNMPTRAEQSSTRRLSNANTGHPNVLSPLIGSGTNKPIDFEHDEIRRGGALKNSAFMHKGFFDILSLANSPAGRPTPHALKNTLSKATGRLRRDSGTAKQYRVEEDPFFSSPAPQLVSHAPAGDNMCYSKNAQTNHTETPIFPSQWSQAFSTPFANSTKVQKKRISVDMIGAPRTETFVHAAHASDAEQAEELLRRWGREGIGKIADPLWTDRCKEAIRIQAARNQAEAVAEVQAALHENSAFREVPKKLQIVNGAPTPSSLTLTTVTPSLATAGHSTLSAYTETTAKNSPNIDRIPEEPQFRPMPQQHTAAIPSPRGPRPALLPRTNTQGTMFVAPSPSLKQQIGEAPDYLQYKPDPTPTESSHSSKHIDGLPAADNGKGAIGALFERPSSMIVCDDQPVIRNLVGDAMSQPMASRAGAALRPSLTTVEKSVAAKIYFENLYYGILKKPKARDTRKAGLEAELKMLRISDAAKNAIRAKWVANETEYLRDVRSRVSANSFNRLKTIGHGAFGVVALIKEKGTGQLFAMKQLRKADMLRKGQEGHVRAERDLMTSASGGADAKWIVKLIYSFQDVDHLYLIMEFMGGGDLLNLLIEKDVFAEDFAKFYVAEMILAIHEAHKLGYIHRDIKPDNFLFSSDGHIKLADFGLCQSFHWAHDGAYYEQQRKNLLRKHGIDLDDAAAGRNLSTRTEAAQKMKTQAGKPLNDKELDDLMSDRNKDGTPLTHVLTWREKNKKKIAYSVVGTNNYMATEVLKGLGYDQSCDWWSLGVIVFEMLYGYPPFVSKSRHLTRQKILNWKQTLRFPPKPRVSSEAQDFISRLICEKDDRLGSLATASVSRPNSLLQGSRQRSEFPAYKDPSRPGGLADGVEELMAHPWFRGIDWDNLHKARAPFVPALSHPADTKHFEDDIDDEPLPAPGAAEAAKNGNPPPVEQPRDPMLRDKAHGPHLLEMRKQLAFVGYTFKSPKSFDPSTQLTESKITATERTTERKSISSTLPIGSRLRSMSM